MIELEVTGVQDVSRRTAEKDPHGARDRVIYGKELGRYAAELHFVAGLHFHELRVFDTMLGELALDKAERELRGVDGHLRIKVFQQIGQRARVVFVAVGDDDAA